MIGQCCRFTEHSCYTTAYHIIQWALLSNLLIAMTFTVFFFGYLVSFRYAVLLNSIHRNLSEVDVLGLGDLEGEIYIMGKKNLMCIEIAIISSYRL